MRWRDRSGGAESRVEPRKCSGRAVTVGGGYDGSSSVEHVEDDGHRGSHLGYVPGLEILGHIGTSTRRREFH